MFKKLMILGFAAASLFAVSAHAATTTFTRNTLWSSPDSALNSGAGANTTGSMWHYEEVDAAAADTNLDGANPWYKLEGVALTWNATNSRWEGAATGAYPRINATQLGAQTTGGTTLTYGHQPRLIWTAPASGTVSLKGKLGFNLTKNSVSNGQQADWAIGKRSSGTYTLLASGTHTFGDQGATVVIELLTDLTNTAALQNIALEAGDELFVTFRGTAITNKFQWLTDSADAGEFIMVIEHTTTDGPSGVQDWEQY